MPQNYLSADSNGWDDRTIIRSTPSRSPWISAVTKQHKLVFSSVEEPWLIDVQNDPQELTNLFGLPEQKPLIRELTAFMRDYAVTHNDAHARHPKIREQIQRILD